MHKVIPEIFFVFFPNHFLYSSNFWLYCTYVQHWFQPCLRLMFTRKIYPTWKTQLSFTEDCLQIMSLNVCHQFLIWSLFQHCGLSSCLRMNENRWRCTSTAVGGTGVGQLINFGEIEVVFAHFARTSKTQSSTSSVLWVLNYQSGQLSTLNLSFSLKISLILKWPNSAK